MQLILLLGILLAHQIVYASAEFPCALEGVKDGKVAISDEGVLQILDGKKLIASDNMGVAVDAGHPSCIKGCEEELGGRET